MYKNELCINGILDIAQPDSRAKQERVWLRETSVDTPISTRDTVSPLLNVLPNVYV